MTLQQDTHLPPPDLATGSSVGRLLESGGRSPGKPRRAGNDRLSQFVRVDETHVGRGVFARRKLKGGMVLGEIQGQIFPVEPADPSYCM